MLLAFVFLFQLLTFEQAVSEASPHQHGTLPSPTLCIPPEEYPAIEQLVKINRRQLIQSGQLPANYQSRVAPPTFVWPVRQATGFNYPGYYSIVNFVDLDPAPNALLDWNCGTRTYDGHRGIDISSFPFWWHMMDNDQVEAVAVADGVIISKIDGNPDRNCSCTGAWNVIILEHEDGYQSWYGHLKIGSQTTKGIGETVEAGEYLGIIGSAGCSSNPHLHLEVRDPDFNVVEPYTGSCNNLATGSLWANQKPYYEGTLNQIFTHGAAPSVQFCPENEATNFQNNFSPGAQVYFGSYYHDQQAGELSSFEVRNSDGTLVYSWNFSSPSTYSWSWWWRSYFIPENGLPGTWQFIGNYKGQQLIHNFTVLCESEITVDQASITTARHFSAAKSITTSGTVAISGNGDVLMTAGDWIQLKPGFSVGSGAQLHAKIEDCNLPALAAPEVSETDQVIYSPLSVFEDRLLTKDGLEKEQFTFKIVPNPARDHFQVIHNSLTDDSEVQLEIYNMNGQLLHSRKYQVFGKELPSISYPTTGLKQSVYLVGLRTAGHYRVQKLIIAR